MNHATVLLNYPTGDVAFLHEAPCGCGRTHRLMSEVDGRVEDVVPLASGVQLHPRAVWAAFKDDRDILQYQLIQHELRHFELKLVTASPDTFAAASARARAALRDVLGDDAVVDVVYEREVGRLERAANGKFRAVESRVTRPGRVAPAGPSAPQTVAGP